MEPWHYPLLAMTGAVVGLINVMAGGGSLISMPVLIFLGLSPAEANGTNRVAILVQNITAVSSFRARGFSDAPLSLTLALCTIPGAVVGALAAIAIDPTVFKRILGGVLVVALVLMLQRGNGGDTGRAARAHLVWAHIASIGAGFYGGFLQAGVGFIFMPILHRLLALDLVRVNMHKVFIIGIYTIPALVVFACKDQVWWLAGLTLAVGNAVGGWLGTPFTITRGEPAIRVVFCLAVAAMAVKLVVG